MDLGKPEREYETEEELELLKTRFSDKSESWLATRRFIHSYPSKSRNVLMDMAVRDPKFLDILHDFELWGRPEQFFDWQKDTLLFLAGRGIGKGFTASNFVVHEAKTVPNSAIGIWGADFGSIKRNNWLGDSGILKTIHPELLKQCVFNKSELTLTFPNGSSIISLSAESFERSRGLSLSLNVLDELSSYSYALEAYEAAQLVLRKGSNPRMLITTTPKPTRIIRDLAEDPDIQVVTGTTYQNYFLPPSYVRNLEKGLTQRMQRQELYAEVLNDNLNAMFKYEDIDAARVNSEAFDYDIIKQFCVAVDPAVSANENSDETAIVVTGISYDGEYYVFEDATMSQATPEQWAQKTVSMYQKYNNLSMAGVSIVAEKNQGGLMVQSVIQNAARRNPSAGVPPARLTHSTHGKMLRAEPTAALYEQHIVHHVGPLPYLETQMCEWNPTDKHAKSPDRLDALVFGITFLSKMGGGSISAGYGTIHKSKDSEFGEAKSNPYCGYY